MDDRRRHPRSGFEGTLEIQCQGDPTWFSVFGRDISVGGFGFTSPVALEVGERVLVSAPALGLALAPATVRRAVPTAYGLDVGVEFDLPLDAALAVQIHLLA